MGAFALPWVDCFAHDSVVTKGTAKVGGAQVALKKLLIHNPRDGVRSASEGKIELTKGIGHDRPGDQDSESARTQERRAARGYGRRTKYV